MTSVEPNPDDKPVTRSQGENPVQHPEEGPLCAGDDVISATQILVSYLWNNECDEVSGNHTNHVFQQLRTLTRWLTTTPGD